jgi:hypothetical protein
VGRLDLPPGAPDWAEAAAAALGVICRMPDVTRFAAVVYTDDPFRDDDGGIAGDGFVRYLLERADHCGLEVVDALCVAADGWGGYLDDDCPRGGHPLSAIETDDAPPRAPIRADQFDGVALPPADLAEKERVGRALRELEHARAVIDAAGSHGGIGDLAPRAVAAACMLDDLPATFEESLTWDEEHTEPFLAATMLWALGRPAFRDVALTQWSSGLADGYATLEWNDRWTRGERSVPDGPIRLMGEGSRPDPERLERALTLVRRIAAAAPKADRVGPLAAAAWLSWALGNLTHAAGYVTEAMSIDAHHGLANIMSSMVGAGYLPPWAFARG